MVKKKEENGGVPAIIGDQRWYHETDMGPQMIPVMGFKDTQIESVNMNQRRTGSYGASGSLFMDDNGDVYIDGMEVTMKLFIPSRTGNERMTFQANDFRPGGPYQIIVFKKPEEEGGE